MLQRDHLHVGGCRDVHRSDDLRDALQVVGVVGDDQRVVAGVGVDRVVRADQRPQHGDQVVGVLVLQAEDLRDDLVAPATGLADRHGARLDLALGLGHHLQQAGDLDDREAEAAQRCQETQERVPRRQRLLAVERDLAAHPRVHDDLALEDGAHGAGHALDLGVDEVQRHRFAVLACWNVDGRHGLLRPGHGDCTDQRDAEYDDAQRRPARRQLDA